jgi:hypothetical protein
MKEENKNEDIEIQKKTMEKEENSKKSYDENKDKNNYITKVLFSFKF